MWNSSPFAPWIESTRTASASGTGSSAARRCSSPSGVATSSASPRSGPAAARATRRSSRADWSRYAAGRRAPMRSASIGVRRAAPRARRREAREFARASGTRRRAPVRHLRRVGECTASGAALRREARELGVGNASERRAQHAEHRRRVGRVRERAQERHELLQRRLLLGILGASDPDRHAALLERPHVHVDVGERAQQERHVSEAAPAGADLARDPARDTRLERRARAPPQHRCPRSRRGSPAGPRAADSPSYATYAPGTDLAGGVRVWEGSAEQAVERRDLGRARKLVRVSRAPPASSTRATADSYADVRAAEAVDRLLGIADDEELPRRDRRVVRPAREQEHDLVLQRTVS